MWLETKLVTEVFEALSLGSVNISQCKQSRLGLCIRKKYHVHCIPLKTQYASLKALGGNQEEETAERTCCREIKEKNNFSKAEYSRHQVDLKLYNEIIELATGNHRRRNF